ncbi:MAG: M20/M25/M40 family metallo-hydrolase, partial [Armatimonadetes bacterium]|nr:M20/M25/M40 family metallo-hydrolase [Armatimonadota bacterium]
MSQISCDDISAAVAASAEQARAWLMQMISYPSTQGNEADCQAYIKELFEQVGWPAEYRQIPDELVEDPQYSHSEDEQPYEGRCNLVARRAGHGQGRSLILQTHADVVPASDWKEAFNPRFDGEFVHGRGSTDCKGQIAMVLMALAALDDLDVKLAADLEVQIVIEEEVGGNGALALIRQGCSVDGVIVAEASGLDVFPANRGAVWFRAKTTGTPTHMGRRHEAQNAIEKMMEAIKWMLVYEKELIAASAGYPLFERYEAPVQLCLGTIRAEGWPSMVAGECVLEGGVGFLPNKAMDDIKQELYEAVMRSDDEWLREHFELTFPRLHNDAYEIAPDHPLVTTLHQSVCDCGIASEVYGWNVSCDA